MTFHAFHGFLEVERELGQVFAVDVVLDFDLKPEDIAPSVNSIVNGNEVYDVTKNIMMGTKFRSTTSLALAIAKELLSRFKQVKSADVRVGRKQLFIAGDVKEILAEVSCSREDFEKKS
jgi:dihydroneopterin aldolase